MATAEVISLALSPPRFLGHDIALLSSSPQFPSPGALLRSRPQLPTCHRASPTLERGIAPLQATAGLSTRTTGDQLGLANTSSSPVTITQAPKEVPIVKTSRSKATSKPQKKTADDNGDQPVVKKPRKPRAKKVDIQDDEKVVPKQKAPRKQRVKKDNTDGQTKLAKGSVTKPSAGSRVEKPTRKKKAETVSSHFSAAVCEASGSSEVHKASENDLLLQEAVKRRVNWTPPKPTTNPLDLTGNPESFDGSPANRKLFDDQQKTIVNLFGDYGYKNGKEMPPPERIPSLVGPRKRKLIELVKTSTVAPETPVAKVKAVKKKPRTITDQATSAYAVKDSVDMDAAQPPLLQHLPHGGELFFEKGGEMFNGLKVRARTRSKSPAKGSKAQKGTVTAPILLSPESAMKQVEKQEFVFGTLSQLAREESPTLLRDLQQAMQESNRIDENQLSDIMEECSPSKLTNGAANMTTPFAAKRSLWAAASRGIDRALLGVETVDLSESPLIQKSSLAIAPAPAPNVMSAKSTGTPESDEWYELGDKDTPVRESLDPMELPPSNQESLLPPKPRSCSSSFEKIDRGTKKKRSKTDGMTTKLVPATIVRPEENSSVAMPDFGCYTTAQLAKEIASYRFKPVKSRDQMILLLEKCWQGKQRIVLGGKEPNTIVSAVTINPVVPKTKMTTTVIAEPVVCPSATARMYSTSSENSTSPKATKKRTKSSESKSQPKTVESQPLVLRQTPKKPKRRPIPEEIDDSDTPLTPSPPRRLRLQTNTPPLTLHPSTPISPPVADDESLLLSPTSQQLLLRRHITRAIHAAPPSTDPKNPSWHEKMLLYDPIVLEDLATWLNTGGLQRVGWDGEVAPFEVKGWCVANSICCLWKTNLRGGVRSRY